MTTNVATTATRRETRSDRSEREGERYDLLGEIATGGMATVYLGRMRRPMGFARLVAIKCMHPQYAKDPSFASMFLDEARLTARLRHPNIVPTLDIVADGGHLLIVMEYVEGESLAELLKLVRDANDRIPVAVACAIIHDLLLGLHEAHESRDDDGSELGLIHRDVSPQNVILGHDGLARVLDFGVAKARSRAHHSHEGEIKGKLPYMPPEQLFGETVDRRVDIYGAGVLLWEALVGARLFDGPSEEIIVKSIDAGGVAAPSTRASGISAELDALVLRAISPDPAGRFPTALAMAEALSKIAGLPPRTEISAWMKRFSTPRPVPAAAIGCSRDLTEQNGVNADAIVAVLERATMTSERYSRASLMPVSHGSAPPPALLAKPTSRITMFAGVAAFAIAGVLVGRAMRAENAHASSAHHAAAAATTAVAAAAAVPQAIEPAAAPAVVAPSTASEAPARTSAKVAISARAARAAASANAKTASSATPADAKPAKAEPATTADAKPASCRLPYTVDAEGHRHYKVECL